jgi:hypothetical protein
MTTISPSIELLLPTRIRDLLNSCPQAGTGVHKWLIKVAVKLHPFFTNKEDIAELLWKYSADCGRDVDDREVWEAIESSARWLKNQKGEGGKRPLIPKWPNRNPEIINAIVRAGPSIDGLIARSPVRLTADHPRAEEIMATLFPVNSLVCVGKTKESFKTAPLERWLQFRLLRQMPFVVPSPMLGVYGRTKGGKNSMHCLENTGPRRFLVIEFDPQSWKELSPDEQASYGCEDVYKQRKKDEHAALLWHLAEREKLVLAVDSGKKSVHGWFHCEGRAEESLLEFMRYAVSLGADDSTWTKSQFVRIPDGLREDGKRQRVLYFDPNILEGK